MLSSSTQSCLLCWTGSQHVLCSRKHDSLSPSTLLPPSLLTGQSGHHELKALQPRLSGDQGGLYGPTLLHAIGRLDAAHLSYRPLDPQNAQFPSISLRDSVGLVSSDFISRVTQASFKTPSLKTSQSLPPSQVFGQHTFAVLFLP